MNSGRKGSSQEQAIEMQTFNEPVVTRSRSGSLTGHIDHMQQGRQVGYSKFSFSKTTGVFDVKTISSDVRGGGSRMMAQMESLAREHEAREMVAGTSRPGFFKKSGFAYTPTQDLSNIRKYTQAELLKAENNRAEGGGAFDMFKKLGT